jgi:hypothetical protein
VNGVPNTSRPSGFRSQGSRREKQCAAVSTRVGAMILAWQLTMTASTVLLSPSSQPPPKVMVDIPSGSVFADGEVTAVDSAAVSFTRPWQA